MPLARFINSYGQLPANCFVRMAPESVSSPKLIKFNNSLADDLMLDWADLCPDTLTKVFSGNQVPDTADPMATAYAGHQFGNFVPQLGDGRAILLGDVSDQGGRLYDIQLKGAGRTPYSRSGDGRAALGPVLREYLISEAMHALGIPSTRALAAVSTGDMVYREDRLPGAIITRVAASHLRIGTFQYFAARRDLNTLRQVADYAIARHYPDSLQTDNPYLALLDQVIDAQASLIAKWMNVGFIHGVMNTDNMTISGETIDFGPCAFMEAFDPATVFSAIDQHGRYAYGNQPRIGQWNLTRFAETLLPLISDDQDQAVNKATDQINSFSSRFRSYWLNGMRTKMGLNDHKADDLDLANELLTAMQIGQVDFTLGFRNLGDAQSEKGRERFLNLFAQNGPINQWLEKWLSRQRKENLNPILVREKMNRVNPAFIPRNHMVELMIADAVAHNRFDRFEDMLAIVSRPFDDQPEFSHYADPARPEERVRRTYCGT